MGVALETSRTGAQRCYVLSREAGISELSPSPEVAYFQKICIPGNDKI